MRSIDAKKFKEVIQFKLFSPKTSTSKSEPEIAEDLLVNLLEVRNK